MILTPALFTIGGKLAERVPQRPARATTGLSAPPEHGVELEDHVIIAGYGVNGQNLARALMSAGIRYVIMEMNPETVRVARGRGEPIVFGDCTRAAVLEGVGLSRARMFVVAISDAASSRQAVSLARTVNPSVYILVRTRFVSEMHELRGLGANEVIPEEFETSVEIFARVLHRFDVPRNVILDLVGRVRGDMYDMLRSPRAAAGGLAERIESLPGVLVESLYVTEASPAAGHSLAELELRPKTGASVIGVERDGKVQANPDAAFRIESGDVLLVLGDQQAINAAVALLDPTAPVA
jgi:CPA2 family monovalent cation:H+ antiporter-2